MALQIRKAQRKLKPLKMLLSGPSGSGKTYSALRIGAGLISEGKVLLLDSERGSGNLYADLTDYDHADLPGPDPETYIDAIREAEALEYALLIIDGSTPIWEYLLDQHSRMQGNSYTNWARVTPRYNAFLQAVLRYPGHVISTVRAKTKYELNEKGRPERLYVDTIARPGTEYEFDVLGMLDISHNLHVEKTRFDWLADKIISKPGEDLGRQIGEWLNSGAPTEAEPIEVPPAAGNGATSSDNGAAQAELYPDEWRIETAGSAYHGRTLLEIAKQKPGWLKAALKPGRREKFSERDVANIEAFLGAKS